MVEDLELMCSLVFVVMKLASSIKMSTGIPVLQSVTQELSHTPFQHLNKYLLMVSASTLITDTMTSLYFHQTQRLWDRDFQWSNVSHSQAFQGCCNSYLLLGLSDID